VKSIDFIKTIVDNDLWDAPRNLGASGEEMPKAKGAHAAGRRTFIGSTLERSQAQRLAFKVAQGWVYFA
jgi:hypothetical protein